MIDFRIEISNNNGNVAWHTFFIGNEDKNSDTELEVHKVISIAKALKNSIQEILSLNQ